MEIAVVVVLFILWMAFSGGSESKEEGPSERERTAPVCSGCTHHISAHQSHGAKCSEMVKTATEWERDRATGEEGAMKWGLRQCTCAGYDGPPLPDGADASPPQEAERPPKDLGR